MATARNVFVKSKMNKDLDDRLIGKGEYRDAKNVNISRSEGDDVGAIENVLGNELLHAFTLPGNRGMEAIGVFEDITNNLVYIFATDYTDTSDNALDNFAPYNAKCGIFSYNLKTNANKTLVQGRFLNFSKRSLIGGVNLIEDLLFFTDNRNQPRKINVQKAAASSTHYTTEDQISVTKYAPYQAPRLYNTFSVTPTSGTGIGPYVVSTADHAKLRAGQYIKASTSQANGRIPYIIASTDHTNKSFMLNQVASPASKFSPNQAIEIYETSSKNVTQEFTSPTLWADFANISSTQVVVTNPSGEIKTNMLISNETIQSKITVASVTSATVFTITPNTASVRAEIAASGSGGKLLFSDPNSQYISSFPGDEEYLSDKFVRFSYRFKFEDGEYSLIAPFTQPAFVPKQSGYLVDEENTNNDVKDVLRYGATNKIVESTILAFFENSVNRVDINIPTPFLVNQLADKLKISEIDILYNESDALAVRVLDTIPVTDDSITSNSTNIYTYNYNSEKPFRTLPEPDVVRVFDVCPVRAKTQSVSGNRVIYGNFLDKHTPPENLNYNTRLDRKSNSSQNDSSYAEIAYPYHSVKQNRTYQVGVILSDRYGRSTDVILSSLSNVQFSLNNQVYGGDTIYAPYRKSPQPNANDPSSAVQKWFGDSLKILFRDVIPESVTYADGYPGVYKSGEYTVQATNTQSAGSNLFVTSIATEIEVGNILIDGAGAAHTITSIDRDTTSGPKLVLQPNIPQTTSGQVFNVYGPSNPLGFYSYKIVIQQPAADYYNAYLGNVVMGEFRGAKNSADVLIQGNFRNTVSYTSLIGSNINKIPANTTNLQPEQTLFSTADEKLFPRVNSTFDGNDESTDKPQQQFIGKKFCTGSIIGKLIDLGIRDTSPSDPPRIKEGADLVDSITFQADPNAYNPQVKQNVKPISTQLPGATAVTSPANDSMRVTITTTGSAGNALVTKVEVTNPGSGYVVGETLTFSGEDFGGGTAGSPVGNNMVLRIRQSDTDIQESGVGFFQAQQNPTAVKIINPNVRIGNPSAGTRDVDATGNDSLFNVFEIKSPESNLEIFYETSTSGLVSEINTAILSGTPASEVAPDLPVDES